MSIFLLIQQSVVDEKIKNAPDGSYEIGVLIGSFIPFIVLVGLAYWMYSSSKKRE